VFLVIQKAEIGRYTSSAFGGKHQSNIFEQCSCLEAGSVEGQDDGGSCDVL